MGWLSPCCFQGLAAVPVSGGPPQRSVLGQRGFSLAGSLHSLDFAAPVALACSEQALVCGPRSRGRSPAWRTLRPSELLERGNLSPPPLLRRHGSSAIGFCCLNTKEPFPLPLAWPGLPHASEQSLPLLHPPHTGLAPHFPGPVGSKSAELQAWPYSLVPPSSSRPAGS